MTSSIDSFMKTCFLLQQFYYREARLLDQRQYQQWMALCCEDISYIMPNHFNPQRDISLKNTEAFLSLDQEFEGADAASCPIREENYLMLSLRVDRAFKFNAWGENPPPATRRFISNIELIEQQEKTLAVSSNFLMHYNRWGKPAVTYTGQRLDQLLSVDDDFLIQRREVKIDSTTVHGPTLGLFF